jgi:SM-20-related protein
MIDLNRISNTNLKNEPYRWAAIDELFSPADAAALAATFPSDHFKDVAGYDGEKNRKFEIRPLIRMGEQSISGGKAISAAWRALANDFLAPTYRDAIASLTGIDLREAGLEVNVFHYPPGGSHGPHPDHRNKLVTHVLYFNESWNDDDGGCLTILRSSDPGDIASIISPRVGNSALLVRSDDSWHAVSHVAESCGLSRRSLTVTFYRPGTVSMVWPHLLHGPASRIRRVWHRLTSG